VEPNAVPEINVWWLLDRPLSRAMTGMRKVFEVGGNVKLLSYAVVATTRLQWRMAQPIITQRQEMSWGQLEFQMCPANA